MPLADAASETAKYSLSGVSYNGRIVSGNLVLVEGSGTDRVLQVRVTFFIVGNYYMATVGEVDNTGHFEIEGVGPIEFISVVAFESNGDGQTQNHGSSSIDVYAEPEPTAAPTTESTAEPTSTPTPEPTNTPAAEPLPTPSNTEIPEYKYVLNTHTKKFHRPSCTSVGDILEKNKKFSNDTREEIIDQGYVPCKRCNP